MLSIADARKTWNRSSGKMPAILPASARMKENSPIWARPMPACIEAFTPEDVARRDAMVVDDLRARMKKRAARTRIQLSRKKGMSMSIPIETKKRTRKLSLKGRISDVAW